LPLCSLWLLPLAVKKKKLPLRLLLLKHQLLKLLPLKHQLLKLLLLRHQLLKHQPLTLLLHQLKKLSKSF
jgi:hypothetical protein